MKVHRKTNRNALNVIFLMCFLISFPALADMNDSIPAENPPATPLQKTLLKDHTTISAIFDNLAQRLDLFLTGQKLSKTRNETRVVIGNSNMWIEGSGYQVVNNFAVNLQLPNTEKYWQLKFTNYDQQTESRGVRGAYLKQKAAQRNYGATVGFFRSFDNVQFKFRPRIILEDPLNISHSMSFDSALKTKYWDFSPLLEFFATPDKGTGIFVSLNSGYQINNTYSLSFVNEAEYQEKFHLFIVTQGVSFGQVLDDVASLSYNLFFVSNSRPNYKLESFNISTAFSAILYKDIIDMQLIPALNFSRYVNYHGVGSVTLNFNIYF